MMIEGMGHHLASQDWDRVIDAITRTARRASA